VLNANSKKEGDFAHQIPFGSIKGDRRNFVIALWDAYRPAEITSITLLSLLVA
jgi:hypothetical protein